MARRRRVDRGSIEDGRRMNEGWIEDRYGLDMAGTRADDRLSLGGCIIQVILPYNFVTPSRREDICQRSRAS